MRHLIFISYSHVDKPWLGMLQEHLDPLLGEKEISIWSDTNIAPGKTFEKEINKAIDSAKIAVLLVTKAFLDSDFILERELPSLIKAARKKRINLFWIAVGECHYKHTALKTIQAANDPTRPLEDMSPDECQDALANICKKIIEGADSDHSIKAASYYVNYIPFALLVAVITVIAVLILGNYVNAGISLTPRQTKALIGSVALSASWIVGLGFYAHRAFKHNRPIPAPDRFWPVLFGKLATTVGSTEWGLTRHKVLIVSDNDRRNVADQIKNEYNGKYLEIEEFICSNDFSAIDLLGRLRRVQALYLFRTKEIQDNKQFWTIVRKWEVEETHKPIFVVDFLSTEYKLPYTRIPEERAVQGVWILLAHGIERANLWHSQAQRSRRFWIITVAAILLSSGVLIYSLSKFRSYRLLQNVYQGIAKQTRDEIKRRVKEKYDVADDTLNVSYWFPYQGRLYQLGTTEADPENSRSDFDADQNIEPTLIGCGFAQPNHSVQWDNTSGNTVIVDSYGKLDPAAKKCTFKMLHHKKFQSMVCTTYSPSGNPVVGICIFTDNGNYTLGNELVSEYLRERAQEYYFVVSDLLKDGRLVPQKYINHENDAQ